MYGHGVAPPTRSTATVITLRVLFVAAGFLSCGLLACVPLFRVALLRGRVADWVAAWASLPVSVVLLMVIGTLPESDTRTDVAVAMLLILGTGAAAYYLTVDIRFHHRLRQYGVHGPPSPHATTMHASGPGTPSPYGYPQPASPYAPTVVSRPQAQMPGTPGPSAPHPTPGPHRSTPSAPVPPVPQQHPGQPARIDQVRAELDELSDYLRRSDGHEGGDQGHGHGHGGR